MSVESHLAFVGKLTDRIIDASSPNPAKPVLSLSFVRRFPAAEKLTFIQPPVTLADLSKGCHYALILSLFDDVPFYLSNRLEIFGAVLRAIRNLGFKPELPCDAANLTAGVIIDHINLCNALEFAISEKSVDCALFVDDLRHLPRSFFVLREFPVHTDDALLLWLNKFHCFSDLYQIDAPQLQVEIPKWTHVAAILSRIFPTRIPKSHIKRCQDLTPMDISRHFDLISPLLRELGVFIPSAFPLPLHLTRFFIGELYWATRPGVHKFARLDVGSALLAAAPGKVAVIIKVPRNNGTRSVVKVSPRRTVGGSLPVMDRPSPENLLEIYEFMSKGDRKDKFQEVADPSVLITNLISLMAAAESEQTFPALESLLSPSPEANLQLLNGIAFLTALSGSNNEFGASRTTVFFARRMIQTVQNVHAEPPRVPKRKVARVRIAVTVLFSIATQTASMTQNCVALRETSSSRTKPRTGELVSVSVQTDPACSRPSTAAPITLSYPYGATAVGFARVSRRMQAEEAMSARRPKI
jgi:hypothetical protein